MFSPSNNKYSTDLDLVYVPADTEEFRSIHVEIVTKDDKLNVSISSEWDISIEDLEKLINKLQRNTLSKMRISIERDCDILLYIKGIPHEIEFSQSVLKVGAIKVKR